MAELAAKIRAKFKRRHSAIPGIPSLLSRSSVRSSGSHSSSLVRTSSYHSHHGGIGGGGDGGGSSSSHNEDSVSPVTVPKSRAGSSHISVIDLPEKDSQEADVGARWLATAATAATAVPQDQNQQDKVLQESQAPASDPRENDAHFNQSVPAPEPAPEPETEQAPVPAPAQTSANDDNLDLPKISSVNSADPQSNNSHSVDVASQSPNNGTASPIAGALTADAPSTTAPDTDAPDPPPLPADQTNTGQASGPTPLTSTMSDPPAASEAPKASDPSGNDLHSMHLRKLSSINEHPSPDQEAKIESTSTDLHQQPNTTAAQPSSSSNVVAVVPILPATKQDDPKPELIAPPRTPKLAASSTGRPLHIPLPQASFGPPSISGLSPLYGIGSTTAPSSPLRHSTTVQPPRPAAPIRRQSLLSNRQSTLIQTLLRGTQTEENTNLNADSLLPISGNMVTRKIWVKRPGGSATLVTINEDDVVDDVRDMILRKYANSLGRQFDAPDLTLRIRPHGNQQERMLSPEEPMARTLDAYFPGGQSIEDALLIDVPLRRTPRASPRSGPPHAPHIQYFVEDRRPAETANDYFGPGAVTAAAHVPVTVTAPANAAGHQHAIAVLNTGQVPPIPSPGGTVRARNYRERPERPRLGRQHTSSPTLINLASGATHQASIAAAATVPHGTHPTNTRSRSRTHSEASDQSQNAPQPPPMQTPPTAEASAVPPRATTPPPRTSSPMTNGTARPKKVKKNTEHPSLPKGMLNGSVPPINVLIVEDNIINLKLLEAFVKRLKVRWSTAMNGRDAVNKWRDGGYHLVLMDIQLPVMSGLDATREIRRLERVNSIGVFSSAASTAPEEVKDEPDAKDKLENMDLFKSPVIIVALTASSLQSDRHEALAAGCNDFLTKVCCYTRFLLKFLLFTCSLTFPHSP